MTDSTKVVPIERIADRKTRELEKMIRNLDEATRDAHHASSVALKLLFQARRRLGLVELPMP